MYLKEINIFLLFNIDLPLEIKIPKLTKQIIEYKKQFVVHPNSIKK